MTITYHRDLVQGSDEWHAARCGLLTASEMKLILTPTLKFAANDKERAHLYELLAQRVTRYVEPSYISYDMLRGKEDEIEARALYDQLHAPVQEAGFVTNDEWGFTLGYSPDGLVDSDGQIEAKSRCAKYQAQTIIENVGDDRCTTIPPEFMLQVQTGLLVTRRKWTDFISYCGGMPMVVVRVLPIPSVQEVIIGAATAFEKRLAEKLAQYHAAVTNFKLPATERRIEQEMYA